LVRERLQDLDRLVLGGLLVTSYAPQFTPFTSLMIRVAVSPRNFMSKE